MHRGRVARNETRQMRLNRDVQEQTDAAVRIQAVHRGREARRSTVQMNPPVSEVAQVPYHERLAQKLDGRLEQLETGVWVQQQEEEMEREDAWRAEQAQAATRIQARQRGKQARRQATVVRVDTDVGASMESLENSEASPPVQPWPAGHSPIPQKSRLPLPAAGHMSNPPNPHSRVRFGAETPQPMPPLESRNNPPNGGRSLQIQRGHAAPLDPISSHRPEYPEEPDYSSDPFVVAMNGKREKIEQQVAALQSRIVEQVASAKGVDLDTADSDGILEEVKVFGALNAQMEQLVSLENEFLRGMPHTMSSCAVLSYIALCGALCHAWFVRPNTLGLTVHSLQQSISRRNCCWHGIWPHQIRVLHPQSSDRSLVQTAHRSSLTTVLNLTESVATTSADRSVQDERHRLTNAHFPTHRTGFIGISDVGNPARKCLWARAGPGQYVTAGNLNGVTSLRELQNERPS